MSTPDGVGLLVSTPDATAKSDIDMAYGSFGIRFSPSALPFMSASRDDLPAFQDSLHRCQMEAAQKNRTKNKVRRNVPSVVTTAAVTPAAAAFSTAGVTPAAAADSAAVCAASSFASLTLLLRHTHCTHRMTDIPAVL